MIRRVCDLRCVESHNRLPAPGPVLRAVEAVGLQCVGDLPGNADRILLAAVAAKGESDVIVNARVLGAVNALHQKGLRLEVEPTMRATVCVKRMACFYRT